MVCVSHVEAAATQRVLARDVRIDSIRVAAMPTRLPDRVPAASAPPQLMAALHAIAGHTRHAAPHAAPNAKGIPRVFARRPDVTPRERERHDRNEVRRSGEAVAADANRRALAAPAEDVNRLTDQVLQALDRRLIAQRERLGRI